MISIITPNFNKATFLPETIHSVRCQSYHDWELLIVDDGSTDNSINLINDCARNDNRIKLIQRNRLPKGGSTCRNIGLANSTGNYIIFLDSDDLLMQNALENRIKLMITYPQLDFAVFSMGTFFINIGDSKSVWFPPKNNHLKRFLRHDLPWSIMQPIWKKDFLEKLTGFDEDFLRLQDVELHTRALMRRGANYKIDIGYPPDCYYRIDNKRILSSHYDFISNLIEGSLLYVNRMTFEIDKSETKIPIRKRYLRGTVLSVINQLLYRRRQNYINEQEKNHLLSKILSNPTINLIISKKSMRLYISLTDIGLYRIKGFNYLYKKIFTL